MYSPRPCLLPWRGERELVQDHGTGKGQAQVGIYNSCLSKPRALKPPLPLPSHGGLARPIGKWKPTSLFSGPHDPNTYHVDCLPRGMGRFEAFTAPSSLLPWGSPAPVQLPHSFPRGLLPVLGRKVIFTQGGSPEAGTVEPPHVCASEHPHPWACFQGPRLPPSAGNGLCPPASGGL